MVNATFHPCSSSRRMESSALTAPLLLEPRIFTKPNLRIMRPVYSPSKLSLLMTRTCRLRHRYIAGYIQLCQNEQSRGSSSERERGPPFGQAVENRIDP